MMSWLIRIRKANVFRNGKQVLYAVDWAMKNKENWCSQISQFLSTIFFYMSRNIYIFVVELPSPVSYAVKESNVS